MRLEDAISDMCRTAVEALLYYASTEFHLHLDLEQGGSTIADRLRRSLADVVVRESDGCPCIKGEPSAATPGWLPKHTNQMYAKCDPGSAPWLAAQQGCIAVSGQMQASRRSK